MFVFYGLPPLWYNLATVRLLEATSTPQDHCLPQATVTDALYFCGDAIVLPQDSSVLHTHTHIYIYIYFKFQFSFKATLAATIHQSRKTLSQLIGSRKLTPPSPTTPSVHLWKLCSCGLVALSATRNLLCNLVHPFVPTKHIPSISISMVCHMSLSHNNVVCVHSLLILDGINMDELRKVF